MHYKNIEESFNEIKVKFDKILILLFTISLFFVVYIPIKNIEEYSNIVYFIYVYGLFFTLIIVFNFKIVKNMYKISLTTLKKYPLLFGVLFLIAIIIFPLFKGKVIYYVEFISILMLMHLLLVFFPDQYLNRLFMLKFLNFRLYNKKKTNLLYSSRKYKKYSSNIYFYITQVGNQYDDIDQYLKNRFYELFMFWYANSFYQFKYRAIMGSYFLIISIISYASFSYIVLQAQLGNFSNNVLIVIYLILLSIVMLHYLNNFLNIDDLLNKINKSLNRYFFKTSTNRQKILLFLQKNFLVYIDDKIANRRVVLNSSNSFKRMIKDGYYDKRGRNLLVGLFVSLLFIIFVQLTSVMLIAQPQLENNSTSFSIQKDKNVFNNSKK